MESGVTLLHGDCLELMATLPDNSIDLIATDPPYFRVKGEQWDRQWDDARSFLGWIDQLCVQWSRILRPNGSLYVFASPQMSARVECVIAQYFNILNRITWVKEQGRHKGANKESLRSYFPQTESIVFAEHFGADNMAKGEAGYEAKCDELRGFVFEPLRAYFNAERIRSGLSSKQIQDGMHALTGKRYVFDRHTFSRSQWDLPTREQYHAARIVFNASGVDCLKREYDDLKREYDDLKREYDDLKREYETLRRPFNVTPDVPYTDVWSFLPVLPYDGKHSCEKPQSMMRHIIQSSSNVGAIVLDCFAGSGTTGVAAVNTRRNFIGIERDDHYFAMAQKRIQEAQDLRNADMFRDIL